MFPDGSHFQLAFVASPSPTRKGFRYFRHPRVVTYCKDCCCVCQNFDNRDKRKNEIGEKMYLLRMGYVIGWWLEEVVGQSMVMELGGSFTSVVLWLIATLVKRFKGLCWGLSCILRRWWNR